MERVFNFSPGPAMLPQAVLEQIQLDLLDWQGTGMSVMEVTHRGPAFSAMALACEALLRKLLQIPDDYRILFLPGGATLQFSAVPLNILRPTDQAGYLVTGVWSQKASQIAATYGQVEVVATATEANGLTCLPCIGNITKKYRYLYYTDNETISGLQYHTLPIDTDIPLVCDMTSSLMSQPLDIGRFGVIFASAQKNLGQAGITIVIIREDLLGQARDITPSVMNYTLQAAQHSMLNTPPTFAWYVCYLMLQWIDSQGGVTAMQQQTVAKAAKVYECIDRYPLYQPIAHSSARSKLNMPFKLSKPALESEFLAQAEQQGLMNLKGHRLIGGIRPSIYLGMPMAGVERLVAFMVDFANQYSS